MTAAPCISRDAKSAAHKEFDVAKTFRQLGVTPLRGGLLCYFLPPLEESRFYKINFMNEQNQSDAPPSANV